jgi:glycolate oxidase
MLETTLNKDIIEKLNNIVGKDFVSTNSADLFIYSNDMTQADSSTPDVILLPQSVGEIQAVVKLANENRIPITPYVAGGNIGGLAIPLKGGIILDLKRMQRIEVNETDMYVVVEPGVTFGSIKKTLDEKYPNLVYTYAFSPGSTSIMCNALLQGLDTLSFRYGAASNWVSGLEVVLPTGDLVKIGSCAVSDTWQSLVPMPELAGLFLGWQGTTGIITRMALSLWPKPERSTTLSFTMPDLKSSFELLKALRWTRVPDDLIGTSFAFGKVARLANEKHLKISLHPAQPILPDDPEFVISAEISGNTDDEIKAKEDVIKHAAKTVKNTEIKGPMTSPSSKAHLPMQAIDVLSAGGGLTWVGCYGPMSRWLETFERGCAVQDKYDITRSGYTRIMNEGHFAAIRWLLPFNKEDPEDTERIKALSLEQLDIVFETGYIPYKTPVWAVRKLEEKAGNTWLNLHRSVKGMLDPDNIMNPGRWGAPVY